LNAEIGVIRCNSTYDWRESKSIDKQKFDCSLTDFKISNETILFNFSKYSTWNQDLHVFQNALCANKWYWLKIYKHLELNKKINKRTWRNRNGYWIDEEYWQIQGHCNEKMLMMISLLNCWLLSLVWLFTPSIQSIFYW